MKTASSRLCLWAMGCFCLTLWLAGCATSRVDWAARVGHFTYDQAVVEKGPPEKQAKLTDGTVVAEWLLNRGTTYLYGGPGPYGPFYGAPYSSYTGPNQYLRLTFGPDGQLAGWKKVYR
jgi:hypothetical protein